MIAREYAGIAEAGGVKNVVCSLSEELAKIGNEITLYIPEYGCTDFSNIQDYKNLDETVLILCNGKKYSVSFAQGKCKNVKVIFVKSNIYKEKNNVYTYCQNDFKNFPSCVPGEGYADSLLLDVLFQKAVCAFADKYKIAPQIIHCHDACVATLPALANFFYPELFSNTKMVVTIHNAGPAYHHEFPDLQTAKNYTELPLNLLSSSLNGQRVEPYILASFYARLTTVSFDYAQELLDCNNHNNDGLSEIFSSRKIHIEGITNGIDIFRYSPEDKHVSLLPFEFSPTLKQLEGKYKCRNFFIENFANKKNTQIEINKNIIKQSGFLLPDSKNEKIYICFHGRLVRQKGILIILNLIDKLFEKYPEVCLIINGQGEKFLEEELSKKAQLYSGRFVYLCGYEKSLARLCTTSGDFALFPSEFEPCGLEDFIAQIYGTIPIAHATGGLKKIIPKISGFTYLPNTPDELLCVLDKIIQNKKQDFHYYDELIQSAALYVKENYTWEIVVNQKYIPFYNQ